jgi:hypothetical protein
MHPIHHHNIPNLTAGVISGIRSYDQTVYPPFIAASGLQSRLLRAIHSTVCHPHPVSPRPIAG